MSAPVFQMDFIQDIKRPIMIQHCGNLVFTGDNLSDTVSVSVLEDGEPYAISGTVSMNAIRADGATVTVTGSVSGNTASATLTQACVAIPGPLAVVMKVTSDTTTTTLLKAVYMVDVGVTGTAVDPGTIIPDINALISAVETAIGSIPADYSDLLAAIAPSFNPEASTPYPAGSYVWYPGLSNNPGALYRFTAAHSGSWTGSDVEAVVFGNEIANLKSAITQMPDIRDSNKTGIDLDVSDENGNVIMRLQDGHIKTLNFDSSAVSDSEWVNKTFCSHGDSITWQDGKAYIQGAHIGEIARGYQTILKEKLGFASYQNYGQSGWSMAVVNGNGIVNTIMGVSSYSGFNLCTIACGTNDFKLNVPLGSLGQIGDTTFDTSTFYGAYRKAVEYIVTSKPTIRLVLMTPLQRDNDGYDVNYTNSAGAKLIDYANAVKNIGEMYALPVCDMYGNSGFTKKTLSTYTMDGLHPNDVGYERMGRYLCRFVVNVGK